MTALKNDDRVPYNYRQHRLHLFGKDLVIAAMARPNYVVENSSNDTLAALSHLTKQKEKTAIIGFYKDSFAEEADKHGLEYYHMHFEDYADIPVESYDKVYETIKKLDQEGKSIVLQCGAGDGRSGTVLAALKMRELIVDKPELLKNTADKTATVMVPSPVALEVKCTPLVKMAVELIREQRFDHNGKPLPPDSGNGVRSVETMRDIRNLEKYEQHLRQQLLLKEDLSVSNSSSVKAINRTNALCVEPKNMAKDLLKKIEANNLSYTKVGRGDPAMLAFYAEYKHKIDETEDYASLQEINAYLEKVLVAVQSEEMVTVIKKASDLYDRSRSRYSFDPRKKWEYDQAQTMMMAAGKVPLISRLHVLNDDSQPECLAVRKAFAKKSLPVFKKDEVNQDAAVSAFKEARASYHDIVPHDNKQEQEQEQETTTSAPTPFKKDFQ